MSDKGHGGHEKAHDDHGGHEKSHGGGGKKSNDWITQEGVAMPAGMMTLAETGAGLGIAMPTAMVFGAMHILTLFFLI